MYNLRNDRGVIFMFSISLFAGHPRFFNQLYAGLDPHGFAGSVITDVLNPSM